MKTIPQFAILSSLANLFGGSEVGTAAKSVATIQLLTEDESAMVAGGPECEVTPGG